MFLHIEYCKTAKRCIYMYYLLGVFLIICIFFICFKLYRKKYIIRKIKQMETCQKICLLNKILSNFGYCYQEEYDIVTTKVDAWQRKFGYASLFDYTALRFGMLFLCEPVFFYYNGKTYRIELWKGQYAVNLGCEVGVYYADGILTPEEFDEAHFKSVPDDELLQINISLYNKGQKVYNLRQRHWWVAGFCVGKYCNPENLVMHVSITFPNSKMLECFVGSLINMGYNQCDLMLCDCNINTFCVSFVFGHPHSSQPIECMCLRAKFFQWINRLLCKIFLFVTRHFSCVLDRLLYLYFFLPSLFRKILCIRRNRKQKYHKKRKPIRL